HAHPPAPHQPHTRFPTRRSSDLKAEQTDLHWFYRRHLTDHEHGHEHAGQNRKVAHCGPPFAPGRYPPEPAPTTASLRHPRTRKPRAGPASSGGRRRRVEWPPTPHHPGRTVNTPAHTDTCSYSSVQPNPVSDGTASSAAQ